MSLEEVNIAEKLSPYEVIVKNREITARFVVRAACKRTAVEETAEYLSTPVQDMVAESMTNPTWASVLDLSPIEDLTAIAYLSDLNPRSDGVLSLDHQKRVVPNLPFLE